MDYEKCVRCGREIVPYHLNDAFYICTGTPEEPHPDFLVSTKFIKDEFTEKPMKKEDKLRRPQEEQK